MEAQAPVNQPKPAGFDPQKNKKKINDNKRKQLLHSTDIVYMKGAQIHTLPSLSKQLKESSGVVIGLQYVWEYRSPSKSVPPHYQCKLCAVSRLQQDMLAHLKGWKHNYAYIKKAHPEKITFEEADFIKDPVIRKTLKEIAAEVEKLEGCGQLKVILKEPCDVPAFKALPTAFPKPVPPPGMLRPGRPPFGPRFSDPMFPGEFPPQDGPFFDHPYDDYKDDFGGYSSMQNYPDSDMNQGPFLEDIDCRPYTDGMNRRQSGGDYGPNGGRNGYGRRGLFDNSDYGQGGMNDNSDYGRGGLQENHGRMNPDEFRGNQDRKSDRPGLMGPAPGSGSRSNPLLTYLETFRIENENDAQVVLKVTQKLTDMLMEYRLKSVSTGSSMSNMPMSSTGFSSQPSRLSGGNDRYSGGFSGPSNFSSGPSRFYK